MVDPAASAKRPGPFISIRFITVRKYENWFIRIDKQIYFIKIKTQFEMYLIATINGSRQFYVICVRYIQFNRRQAYCPKI